MSSNPTKIKPINKYTNTVSFSEINSPESELTRLLQVMQFRINLMKEHPVYSHSTTLDRWGFNFKERDELGIKI